MCICSKATKLWIIVRQIICTLNYKAVTVHICICTVNQLLFDNLVTATMQESDIVGYLQQIYDNFRTCRTAYDKK